MDWGIPSIISLWGSGVSFSLPVEFIMQELGLPNYPVGCGLVKAVQLVASWPHLSKLFERSCTTYHAVNHHATKAWFITLIGGQEPCVWAVVINTSSSGAIAVWVKEIFCWSHLKAKFMNLVARANPLDFQQLAILKPRCRVSSLHDS